MFNLILRSNSMNRDKIWLLAMIVMALFTNMSGAATQETGKKQDEKDPLRLVLKEIVEAELRGDIESIEVLKAQVKEVLANDPWGEVKRQAIEQNLQSLRDEMAKRDVQRAERAVREKATVKVKQIASDDPVHELHRRLRHLNAAIEHLSAAEMPDAVKQLEQSRAKLERYIDEVKKQSQPKPQVVEKPARPESDLAPVLKELRRDLDSLRKEVRELREALKNR
jgi:chromosome segregation ATPase